MADRRFTIVFEENGDIFEVKTPDGQTYSWQAQAKALSSEPQNIQGIVVPLEILTTTTGLT